MIRNICRNINVHQFEGRSMAAFAQNGPFWDKKLIFFYCIAWHRMVLHGIALYFMVLHSFACHCIVLYGIAWYCIISYGIAWYCIVGFG